MQSNIQIYYFTNILQYSRQREATQMLIVFTDFSQLRELENLKCNYIILYIIGKYLENVFGRATKYFHVLTYF